MAENTGYKLCFVTFLARFQLSYFVDKQFFIANLTRSIMIISLFMSIYCGNLPYACNILH